MLELFRRADELSATSLGSHSSWFGLQFISFILDGDIELLG